MSGLAISAPPCPATHAGIFTLFVIAFSGDFIIVFHYILVFTVYAMRTMSAMSITNKYVHVS